MHTFQNKYNCLPGDCANAATFGFNARGSTRGEGDGDGIIEGSPAVGACADGTYGCYEGSGETVLFWSDLSRAGLINGSFTIARAATNGVFPINNSTSPGFKDLFPVAAMDSTDYVEVYAASGTNYFAIFSGNLTGGSGYIDGTNTLYATTATMSVARAFNIDTKMDDGFPQTGMVTAKIMYGSDGVEWLNWGNTPSTAATSPSTTTCIDNNHVANAQMHYSMSINNGSGINCALSFQFE